MVLLSLSSLLNRFLGLTKIEHHIHVIAISVVFFHAVYLLGGLLSRYWFEKVYGNLSAKERIVWRVKMVSFVHAVAISLLAYPLLSDPHLLKNKVFGYTTYSGNVYAVTCGYFIWDIVYVLVQGQHMSFLLHGIACLAVFLYSFTPFLNYYGASFLMFELSTPFLNLVYFMDKCSYSKSLVFKLNGVMLLLTFFFVRIVFGLYMSFKTFANELMSNNIESVITEGYRAPLHLMALYGSANVALNLLNQLWFYKLVSLFIRKLNNSKKSQPTPPTYPVKLQS